MVRLTTPMVRHTTEREPSFRFSRMGPCGRDHQLEDEVLGLIAEQLVSDGGSGREESGVPAGYTYLGQFVAHDLSFDLTRGGLQPDVEHLQLRQENSPSLDLDSLYGDGPLDPESTDLYESDGFRLRTGTTEQHDGFPAMAGCDVPRGAGAGDLAIIADPRNDDNLAVAQTHAAFIRFHNRVVDEPAVAGEPPDDRFEGARELVTKHYQWMIWHDYLPRICSPAVLEDVEDNGRRVFDTAPTGAPSMPMEFSVGTFRLGHSMVRDVYSWNRKRPGIGPLDLFTYTARAGNLGGFIALPSVMTADLRRFYAFAEARRGDLDVPPDEFNFAKRIDTRLVNPLSALPPGTFDQRAQPANPMEANLAFRNLIRAKRRDLASGQQMADRLAPVGVVPLTREQILQGAGGVRLDALPSVKAVVATHTPLWIYILREAEFNEDHKLDGVGARIVAETFHRAIEGSRRTSIFRDPWKPTLGRDPGSFDMADLLLFAFAEDERLLQGPLER